MRPTHARSTLPRSVPRRAEMALCTHLFFPSRLSPRQAVGEPPLYLASSVLFALSDAVNSVRLQRGLPPTPITWSPLTCERLRMLCEGDPCIDLINATYEETKRTTPDAQVPPIFELPDQ